MRRNRRLEIALANGLAVLALLVGAGAAQAGAIADVIVVDGNVIRIENLLVLDDVGDRAARARQSELCIRERV